jgi:uncharacterized membrane protein
MTTNVFISKKFVFFRVSEVNCDINNLAVIRVYVIYVVTMELFISIPLLLSPSKINTVPLNSSTNEKVLYLSEQ